MAVCYLVGSSVLFSSSLDHRVSECSAADCSVIVHSPCAARCSVASRRGATTDQFSLVICDVECAALLFTDAPMLFMIRLSVDVLSYTIGWRMLWAAFVIVLATGLLARTYSRPAAALSLSRWFYEMAAVAVGPLCMLMWGLYCWPPDGLASPHEPFNQRVLDCMALASIAVAAALVWRHRARPGRTLAVAIFSIWWASGAFTTATWAIRNSWP